MSKSPEAFRTISEVAETLTVPPHVLRFWETRFPQVKPVKRGGGRRYYRPEDIRLLRGIRGLLYDDGITIKGVQKILRERGVRHVISLGTPVDGHDGAAAAPAANTPQPVAQPAAERLLPRDAAPPDAATPVAAAPREADLFPEPDAEDGDAAVDVLVAAQTALVRTGDAAPAAKAEEIPARQPQPPQNDKEALRTLVGKLEALRRVMAAPPSKD